MKNLFIGICCVLGLSVQAQTTITRSYPVKAGQQVNFKFDYPVIKISTWDKSEVSVTANIKMEGAEKSDYLVLDQQTSDNGITINGHVDMDKIPRQYAIVRNGKRTNYKTKQEYIAGLKEGRYEQGYEGNQVDITVEIKVPVGVATNVKATYGIVELVNFNGPITVDDTYGGVDATVNTAHAGKVKATTHYGEILTNLDLKITAHEKRDFFDSITADAGNGRSAYIFTSDYGKIYLRKP